MAPKNPPPVAPDDEFDGPSKSSLKRDSQRLQDLGIELTKLKPHQLAIMPLSDELRDAIELAQNTYKNEALRRQLQFIGKLMRKSDHEAIAEAFGAIAELQNREARLLKVIERWRDDLIAGDHTRLEAFINQYPQCDRQQLRQLVKTAQDEQGSDKPPAQTRKLFRFVRDIIHEQPE